MEKGEGKGGPREIERERQEREVQKEREERQRERAEWVQLLVHVLLRLFLVEP